MALTTYAPNADQIVHETIIDMSARPIGDPVHIVQYDDRIPILAVSVYKNGQPYKIPTSANANIRWGKSNHTFVYNPALGISSDRYTLYFEITLQMVTDAGRTNPIVELEISGKVAGSSPIHIMVDHNPIQEGDVESSTEYKTGKEFAERAEQAAKDAEASKTASATSERNAKASETNARSSAERAAVSEANAKVSETNAKKSENAVNSAKTSAENSAKAAKDSETKSKASEEAASRSEANAKRSEELSAAHETNSKKSEDAARQAEAETARYLQFAQFTDTDAALRAGQLEQYLAILETIERMLEDYVITDPIQDSNGNPIIDNNSYAIISSIEGFEGFMRMVLNLQAVVLEIQNGIQTHIEEFNRIKNSLKEYPVGEELKDSSNSSVFDSSGNTIGGQIIHIVK